MAITRLFPVIRVVKARGQAAQGVIAELQRRPSDRRAIGVALQRMGAMYKSTGTTEDLELEITTK
jgi:hypothetical protein